MRGGKIGLRNVRDRDDTIGAAPQVKIGVGAARKVEIGMAH
jgi:hypothetical protein